MEGESSLSFAYLDRDCGCCILFVFMREIEIQKYFLFFENDSFGIAIASAQTRLLGGVELALSAINFGSISLLLQYPASESQIAVFDVDCEVL